MSREPAPDINDILCEFCGYTLNGLPDTGLCPECGNAIALSTHQSSRKIPDWELSARPSVCAFMKIATGVIFTPKAFFRLLRTRVQHPRSALYAKICLVISSILMAAAATGHYFITDRITSPVAWSTYLPLLFIAVAGVSYWLGALSLRINTWAASVEGRYWGYRLPDIAVRRAVQYVCAAFIPATLLPFCIVIGYAILLRFNPNYAGKMLEYLYMLSASVVVSGLYYLAVFIKAMRAIRYANV